MRARQKGRLLTVWAFLLLSLAAGDAGAADKAVVAYMEGEVTVDGVQAAVGTEVGAGSTVRTAADSLCEIVFNTRNVIRMAARTSLVFDTRAVSRGAALKTGALAMVLRNLAPAAGGQGAQWRFSVTTPTTVAGVRGTCFFMRVEDEDSTYICCCNGAIHLEAVGGQFWQNVAALHHRGIRVGRTGSATTPGPAALLYHTDADIEAAAARIGEKVDWSRIEE